MALRPSAEVPCRATRVHEQCRSSACAGQELQTQCRRSAGAGAVRAQCGRSANAVLTQCRRSAGSVYTCRAVSGALRACSAPPAVRGRW
eukprot:scaffold15765_cov62-Phaeocystis_antarctica.AAC.3